MDARIDRWQRTGLDICASLAVRGIDVLALVGAARVRMSRARQAAFLGRLLPAPIPGPSY